MENRNEVRTSLPSSAFDVEYRTQWRDEVDFLASRGIYYTIRRREGEYGIPTYKYTRTAELFIALADFYLHKKPNAKSKATFQGFNKPRTPVQQSFLNKDGTINKEFETVKEENNTIDWEQVKEAKRILELAESQVNKDVVKTNEIPVEKQDDTE